MKTTKYIYGLGLSFVLSGMFLNSCTDANDWGTDASFDRLFGTKQSSFTVTEGAVSAEVEWDSTVDTEYYIIEASTDSLYDEIPMGAENSIVYGEDGSVTQSPYTITGLLGETTYYLRIKSMSKDKQSNWVYLPDYKFTTDKEQIISEVADTDITDESVVLSWEAGLEVTHITYTQDGELVTYTLTDEEKAAGKVTFSGLEPSTEYTFYIYNGEILRGEQTVTTKDLVMVESQISDIQQNSAVFTWGESIGRLTGYFCVEGEVNTSDQVQSISPEQESSRSITLQNLEPNTTYTVAVVRDDKIRAKQVFKTAMGIPSDYDQVSVNNINDLTDALTNKSGKVAILINGNIESSATLTISSNIKSLFIYGGLEKGTDATSIKSKGFKFAAGTDIDVFETYNLKLIGYNSTSYIVDFKGNTESIKINTLSINSCGVSDANGVIRLENSANVEIDKVIYDDCRFKNIAGFGLFTQAKSPQSSIRNILFTNSTYSPSDISKYLIKDDSSSNGINVVIDYATLYGFSSTIIYNQGGKMNLNISNTLFGGFNGKAKLFGNITNAVIEKCENVFLTSGNSFESSIGETVLEHSDEALFESPTAYDFTVKVLDYKNFGDPYWNK